MSPQELELLKEYCADFKSFRDVTVDGSGKNLHDIKNTFDYVTKTLEKYNLTGTSFGSELAEKARSASAVLSELWRCLANLEKSIDSFVSDQTTSNGQS